jgi:hypothetical protein
MQRTSAVRRDALAAAVVFALVAGLAASAVWASGRQMADWNLYRSYGEAIESGLVPYRDFAVEYPPGALPVFLLPALVTSTEEQYYAAFAALMAVVGALGVYVTGISLTRLRRSPRARRRILALLALSPALFGGVLLSRYDLVPAVLVACATALLLHGKLRLAAAVLGAAVAVKAYPLVLVPLLVAWAWRRRGGREAVLAAGIVLAAVAASTVPYLVVSPGGIADSVGGQLERPLQIESLGAAVLLVAHGAVGETVEIVDSHGSDNIAGSTAAGIATVTSLLQLAVLVYLWVRYARGPATTERTLRTAAAVLVALVALGKVVSPQFLVWALFALPLVAGRTGAVAGAFYGVAALATAIWFPALFTSLVREQDPGLSLLVLLRGLALVAALAVLAWPRDEAVTATVRAGPRSPAPVPSPGRR